MDGNRGHNRYRHGGFIPHIQLLQPGRRTKTINFLENRHAIRIVWLRERRITCCISRPLFTRSVSLRARETQRSFSTKNLFNPNKLVACYWKNCSCSSLKGGRELIIDSCWHTGSAERTSCRGHKQEQLKQANSQLAQGVN